MVLNVTEEQKKVIESQGYMVVQFKLWCKKLMERIEVAFRMLVDDMKKFFLFLQDMAFRAFDDIKDRVSRFVEELRPLIDKLESEYYYEPRRKYPFVRSLGRKYQPNFSHRVIYHRCRDRC